MRITHVRLLLVITAMTAACDAPTTAPVPTDVQARFGRHHGGVVGITAGGGKAQLPPGFSALKFAFAAVARADGSATGAFSQRYVSAGGTVEFTGRVSCASFDRVNGRAWIGGIITSNTSSNPGALTPIHEVGDDVWFRVVDNGEGRSAPDDRLTVLGFEGGGGVITSAEYCQGQPWADGDANTWPVTHGNIQVIP